MTDPAELVSRVRAALDGWQQFAPEIHHADCVNDSCAIPAAVLRLVGALRDIVDAHYPVDPCDAHDAELRTIACDTLLALADGLGIDTEES